MADIGIPEHLIALESTAWAEQQEGRLTVATAAAVQQAITEHAAATGVSRYEVEQAVRAKGPHRHGGGVLHAYPAVAGSRACVPRRLGHPRVRGEPIALCFGPCSPYGPVPQRREAVR